MYPDEVHSISNLRLFGTVFSIPFLLLKFMLWIIVENNNFQKARVFQHLTSI